MSAIKFDYKANRYNNIFIAERSGLQKKRSEPHLTIIM